MPVEVAGDIKRGRVYGAWCFHVEQVDATTADVITTITPGFVGTIEKVLWVQGTPVTTAGDGININLEINAVNLVGGVVALTSALCTPLGVVIEGTPVSGSNNFNRTDTVSVEAAIGAGQFAEGGGTLVVIYSQKLR